MAARRAAAKLAQQGLSNLSITEKKDAKGDSKGDPKDSEGNSKFAVKSYGTKGKEIKVKANFFKITLNNSPNYYHYNIEIVPEGAASQSDASLASESSRVASVPAQSPSTSQASAAQSGKSKGKGRKAAAAKRAGVDPSASDPVVSSPAVSAGDSASGPSTSSPSTSSPSASSPPAKQPAPASVPTKTPKSKRVPKQLHNDIFSAVFHSFPTFKCNYLPVFDGEKNFYSKTEFDLPNNSWSGVVVVKNHDVAERYRVNTTVPDSSHYQNFGTLLKKDGRLMPFEMQALDIVVRNGPRWNKIALGPNLFCKFDDPQGRPLRHDIGRGNFKDPLKFIQFGFYQSSRRTEDGLYCNVDRAMAIFTIGGDLIRLIDLIVPNVSKTKQPLEESKLSLLGEHIKGLKFGAKHLNFRTFTAIGVSQDTVNNQVIDIEEDGNKIRTTVAEYFKKKYPEFIKKYQLNQFLPCVKYGHRRAPKYIPIECVYMNADEVYRQKLKPIQQGEVTRTSSQQTPLDRFAGVQNQISTIERDNRVQRPGKQPVDYLNEFGVKINSEPAMVKARIIDAPKLCYGKGSMVQLQNGQWEIGQDRGVIKYEFFKPSDQPIGQNWAVVNFKARSRNERSITENQVMDLVKRLIEDAKVRGMRQLSCPKNTLNFNYRGKGTLEEDLFNKLDKKVRFIVFLIPKDDEIYNEIKSVAELNKFGRGLATQCMCKDQKAWVDEKLFRQYLGNILLKINPKLGGTNQSIKQQDRPVIMKNKETMFMGMDVTHPSPIGDNLKQSISAVVATYTDDFDKVFAKTRIQERGRKELINLKEIMKELLENYQKINKCYPSKVVVYRDGVGEGDFEKMIDLELGGLKEACKELKQAIKFTYIMVQKRHNTRFIPADIRNPKFQNVAPGTCVDSQITHSELFEFYLCSHAGMMGTSRPAKYVVLVDENKLSADDIQKATYWFCHLYPRCTKTASLPPTVWFAHLLAERTRKYLAHHENSDGRSTVSSGSQSEVLSEAKRRELDASITVHPNLNGTLHFI